jgi:thymidylate synthase (FAD)
MTYLSLIWKGWKPQEARDVLPNSVKTEINMTANLREWRHFFTLRCDFAAHPDIRALAIDLLRQFHNLIPIIFDDLYEKWCTNEV